MVQFHLPTLEQEQLARWDERKIFERILARNKEEGLPPFVFFEGPPGANGKPGIHHVLSRVFKDVVLRYRTMAGYCIDRKAGWDTHGLPVELAVEKALGFTKKQDIEAYGIAQFNAKCKAAVWEYLEEWRKVTRRIAFWVDLDDAYVTYHNDYIESLWWTLKEIDKKGLLYNGYRITPHCPRCVTSLSSHELAQGYKDAEDPSVYVKCPVAGRESTFFLVWTTTPWTLPANVALAVGPDISYVEAELNGETYILAENRLSVLGEEVAIKKQMKGSELAGMKYEPLFPGVVSAEEASLAFVVQPADFVSVADGTGIVHIAPAYGEDDAKVGKEHGLPTVFSVDAGGMVVLDVPGRGEFFKKADNAILADLQQRGRIFSVGKITHTYPFCWRCGTPVLYFAKSSWYIAMARLRDQLMANNRQINWVPKHIGEGRFGEWLSEVKDWALSRERYWGTPLPVWRCGCGEQKVVGGMADIEAASPAQNAYFLLRHGEGEHNVQGVLASWPEKQPWHLTEKGKSQVRAAAGQLKEKGIDLIFSSDLARTKETAEIVAEALGLPVEYDERLRESDFGECSGRPIPEYHGYFADPLDRFSKPVPGGESLNDVRRRMVGFVKELQSRYAGKKILIVSHGDPLWMLMTGFAGISDAEALQWDDVPQGEVQEMAPVRRLPYDEMGRMDAHRPFIDEVKLVCEKCGGVMHRVPDVIDVWYDSGAMPFAQWHFPFENKERVGLPGQPKGANFPGDYIAEGMDQTRGWFYTLLAVSTAMGYSEPSYKNVICLGLVLDKHGKKMSKSKGNVVDPWMVADTYGIDALRMFFFSANQPAENKLFDEKAIEEVTKKIFLIAWNVLSFWQMHATSLASDVAGGSVVAPADAPASAHPLDRWMLTRLHDFVGYLTQKFEAYEIVDASRAIGEFVNDLSTWYVRRSRDRFKVEGEDRQMAVATLGYTLRTLSLVMAPFTPFVADALYQAIGGSEDSVHLEAWPDASQILHDASMLAAMGDVRKAASVGLEQRAAAGIPVRQALGRAIINGPQEFAPWMREIVAEELNVHEVLWIKADTLSVGLDTTLTPALRREGAAREMVRTINDARKQLKLTINDKVAVYYEGGDFWQQTIAEHGDSIIADIRAAAMTAGPSPDGAEIRELKAEGEKMIVGVMKE